MLSKKLLSSITLVVFDFDGVFTDNSVYTSENGKEAIRCSRSDGLGLCRLASVGVKCFIVSTESNPVVKKRAQKLKIPYIQNVMDKDVAILDVCRQTGNQPELTMYVGNDINDIPAFKVVGFPIGVADAFPEIFPYIIYRTIKPGGYGAVREICDLIYHSKINDSSHLIK